MESYSQAPVLKHNGEKYQSPHGWGKAIRTHELEAAIFSCLGSKDYAMAKIMLLLTGNAEGFRVSEKTIMERCNISETGYKKARRKLAEMGWIFHKPSDYIQVNFNKIYSDYESARLGYLQKTKEKVTVDEPFALNEPSNVFSGSKTGTTQEKSGAPENTYNNINNNIINNIKNISDKGDRFENTCFVADATSQVFSKPLREQYLTKEEREKIQKEFYGWFGTEEHKIMAKYNGAESNEDYRRMFDSSEYKAFLAEVEKRREALRNEYGNSLKI